MTYLKGFFVERNKQYDAERFIQYARQFPEGERFRSLARSGNEYVRFRVSASRALPVRMSMTAWHASRSQAASSSGLQRAAASSSSSRSARPKVLFFIVPHVRCSPPIAIDGCLHVQS